MKAKHSKRLEKLNNKFPDKVAAIARWLETLTDEEINYFVVFLFALRAWWDKDAPREIELPGGTLKLDEVTAEGNESPAMAICRHYTLDYQRTIQLVNVWHRIRA